MDQPDQNNPFNHVKPNRIQSLYYLGAVDEERSCLLYFLLKQLTI